MKKQTKKLVLSKETVRSLEDGLRHVDGGLMNGGTVVSGCTDCNASAGSCNTCFDGCV